MKQSGTVLAFLLVLSSLAAESPSLGKLSTLEIRDLEGKLHQLPDGKTHKALAIFFLGSECPVSNGYSPELNRIAKAYREKGIAFLGVYAEPDLSTEAARRHAKDYALDFPVSVDTQLTLSKQAGVKVVLSCVVITPEGQILYRGRVDDRYTPQGKRRDVATVFDLKDTLETFLSGKPVSPRENIPFGCPIPFDR